MLNDILRDQCGLDPHKPVLAGISGGPDSLCLLDILRTAGYAVIVAHFNHQLRPEAAQEAKKVSELAERLGLTFVTASRDVRRYADEHSLSVEESARMLRYEFLFKAARQHSAQALAVGHTADDQVETVLMHFLRGAGLAGLKGMEYRTLLPVFDEHIPLVRPLLSLWRTDTEAYCRDHNLRPHYDASNDDPVYRRNRLRHELIPQLEEYNPRFKESLLRSAVTLQGDHSLLQEILQKTWNRVLLEEGQNWLAFDRRLLADQSAAILRNILRRAAALLQPGDHDLGFEGIERALSFIDTPRSLLEIGGGLYLFHEAGKIYFAAAEAVLPFDHWPQVSAAISLTGEWCHLGNGWVITREVSPLQAGAGRPGSDNWSVSLDADAVGAETLLVRPHRPGDRLQPLGLESGSIKLSDLFINMKLPRRARAAWPVVCQQEQIVWVPGFRIAHPFRLTEKTCRLLHLEINKVPEE
jgi:tRNA(Ile)-lysidine synthase